MIKKIVMILKRDGVKSRLMLILIKCIQFTRIIFYQLLSTNNVSKCDVIINQPVLFCGKGVIKLTKTYIGVWPSPHFFSTYAHIEARSKTASIIIGEKTWLNNNVTIIADKTSIEIGDNVLIGQNVSIFDSDFHGLEVKNRTNGKYESFPVKIENNVFIGANVSILKGVTIGENSVVAIGSIVTSSVPSGVIVGGVPAKILKKLK